MNEPKRYPAIVMTHPPMATAMAETCKAIIGAANFFEVIEVDATADPQKLSEDLKRTADQIDEGEGVLCLVDFLGGSPCNAALGMLADIQAEVVTGLNLPMLMKLATANFSEQSLSEAAHYLAKYGQTNIRVASELLAQKGEKK